MPAHRSASNFPHIRTEGGLLPIDTLGRVFDEADALGGMRLQDYGLPAGTRLRGPITEAWTALRVHWESFKLRRDRLREDQAGTTETRIWVQDVLGVLGYNELTYHAAAEAIGSASFTISHRAGSADNAPPVHITSFRQPLDGAGARGGERRSTQAMMQGYLNHSDHLWGVITNGLRFRLLRENRQIDRILLVEFDLEAMLEQDGFVDFQLFWLLLHRSRFVQPGEPSETAWLERWVKAAQAEGTRAMEGLRTGVETALTELGQGLLDHPANDWLRESLASDRLTTDAFYRQLLRLVYRLLFLMVAEERDLLFERAAEGATKAERNALDLVRSRYLVHYSVSRLRREATRRRHREAHQHDLWIQLLVTFDAMNGVGNTAALGLKPLSGGLFHAGSCPDVADDPAPGVTSGAPTDGRPRISNRALLAAVRALTQVTRDGLTRQVNYRDLDVEELGSVYESLLDHEPSIAPGPNGAYTFALGTSGERKSTGSYYTPQGLVQELLNSALDPVIEAALAGKATPEAQRQTLLGLNVCDPACGSGHFLLGAARRIGRRLAEIATGPGYEPELSLVRHGVSEAIRHCIYGVDKNPLAIDLCKVALWIESHEPGAPLGFLNHHIKRGDSLVGVFNLDVIETGVPDDAYTAVSDDDKPTAAAFKKRNRDERPKAHDMASGGRSSVRALSLFHEDELEDLVGSLAARLDEIDAMPDRSMAEVRAKEAAYDQLRGRDDWQAMSAACDLWTYAFFAPLRQGESHLVPTSATVHTQVNGGRIAPQLLGCAQEAREDVGFFHWPLEFPEVFTKARAGFDTVLGNPPWERVKLQEREFFAARDPEIAIAPNKAARDRLIKTLPQRKPELAVTFAKAQREAEGASLFMRKSERFEKTGRGDVNLYSVFAEHARSLAGSRGQAGIIVPTGIATDDTNKAFFADLVDRHALVALFDFENRKKVFEAVDSRMKFSLLVMGKGSDLGFDAAFFLFDPTEVHDPERTFTLTAADIALLNPNTKTCPIFRSERDAELTKTIYRAAPVLVNESLGETGNKWGATFNTMFHMSNDSHLFRTREELEQAGATLGADGRFHRPASSARPTTPSADPGTTEWLPLYEAKLIHQYDHRFATYGPNGSTRDVTSAEHADPDFVVTPRYWVAGREVDRATGSLRKWFLGFRSITNATNERSAIFNVLPRSAVGNSLPVLMISSVLPSRLVCALHANTSAFVFDFATRQSVGGSNFNFFIVKQLPVLPPDTYTSELLDTIVPRVLELTYTAHDMTPFAGDLGYDGPAFTWDEERRAKLRAELDGIYAHLYGVSRDDFAYILDTFPIVARHDLKAFGEFRTKRLCLEAYDHFAPDTLRALELRVREIERVLRKRINEAANGDVEVFSSSRREKLRANYAYHHKDFTGTPSLQDLISSTTMEDLEKLIREQAIWPAFESWGLSKRIFEDRLSDLAAFRNPMAHGRGVSETVRANGEAAVTWFEERLETRSNPGRGSNS